MPSPPLLDAMTGGKIDAAIICPSNPYVSIDPVLAIPGVQELLKSDIPVVAVSPIVGGTAIKGPAAKMMAELGIVPSVANFADHYRGIADGIVIDNVDEADAETLRDSGLHVLVTDTVMTTDVIRKSLAADTLAFTAQLRG